MTITEMIKALEEIREREGDIRVTCYDHYTANEGSHYKEEELWCDAFVYVTMTQDDDYNEIEKVVQLN